MSAVNQITQVNEITEEDIKFFIQVNNLNDKKRTQRLGPNSKLTLPDSRLVSIKKPANPKKPREDVRLLLVKSLDLLEGESKGTLLESIENLQERGLLFVNLEELVVLSNNLALENLLENDIITEDQDQDRAVEEIALQDQGHDIKVEDQLVPVLSEPVVLEETTTTIEEIEKIILTGKKEEEVEGTQEVGTQTEDQQEETGELKTEEAIGTQTDIQTDTQEEGELKPVNEETEEEEETVNEEVSTPESVESNVVDFYEPIHTLPLFYFFGSSATKKNWNKSLIGPVKSVSTLLYENRVIIDKIGKSLLIEKLFYNEKSSIEELRKENEELIQLKFKFEGKSFGGNTEGKAIVRIGDLQNIRSLLTGPKRSVFSNVAPEGFNPSSVLPQQQEQGETQEEQEQLVVIDTTPIHVVSEDNKPVYLTRGDYIASLL